MRVSDYLRCLRQGWRLLLACLAAGTLGAVLLTLLSTPTYAARTQLFVSASTSAADNDTGLNQGGQFAQDRVQSYVDVVSSPLVTEGVVAELGLALTPEQLEERIHATAALNTVVIDVVVEDPSAVQAQRVAQAVAARFTAVAHQIETPAGSVTSTVKVTTLRPAALPSGPVSPDAVLNLALGLVLGLAAGLGLVVLREVLDTSLKTAEALQEVLGLATLGIIGYREDSAAQPLIVHDDPRSPRAEAFRQLRTNLQFLDVDRPPRSIVVASSLPGEGKSTTACNLALALVQSGLRVVLVDGDLRRPRLADYLGLEGAVGLTDVLVGRVAVEDVLQPWGDGRLRVLPSGPTPPNPSELLGSSAMRTLLADLEGQADLVLVDAPPLLPVTDAAVLSTICSGAVLVVRAGSTTREQATRAVEVLRGVDAQVYGAVLSMAPTKGPDAYAYEYGSHPTVRDLGRHEALPAPVEVSA